MNIIKKCYIMSKKAEPLPPLGTVLGNLGVNTNKFCEDFNNYTKNLPNYFIIQVIIMIFENRSYNFTIKGPTTSFLINLLKFEKKIKIPIFDRIHEKIIFCINSDDIIKIALFKFPDLNLQKSIPIILGSLKSMDIYIS